MILVLLLISERVFVLVPPSTLCGLSLCKVESLSFSLSLDGNDGRISVGVGLILASLRVRIDGNEGGDISTIGKSRKMVGCLCALHYKVYFFT